MIFKAPEGWTQNAVATSGDCGDARSTLECGGPPPLPDAGDPDC